jgi:hypothetical protein
MPPFAPMIKKAGLSAPDEKARQLHRAAVLWYPAENASRPRQPAGRIISRAMEQWLAQIQGQDPYILDHLYFNTYAQKLFLQGMQGQ